jgi:DNA topoisomerase I
MKNTPPGALRFVTDTLPGIRRIRSGRGFRYVRADGRELRDPPELARIRSLAIPPAWTSVWVSPIANGHLQATGRDARGRKQYRYHPRFRATRDTAKYERVIAFAEALPAIRRRVGRDLRRRGMSREKVLATIVALLEMSHIRVGSAEYARANRSYGLTTLRNRHARVRGATVRFVFRGKSGVRHDVDIRNPRIANVVRRCQELPGQ